MAGAISSLVTNAFTQKWAKPCFPIFLVTMTNFFLTKGSIDGDIESLTRFVGEARSEYQGRSHHRVDSICEGYQSQGCKTPEYRGQSRRRGCDKQCRTRCLGKSRVEDPNCPSSCEAPRYRGRSYKPTSRNLRVSRA